MDKKVFIRIGLVLSLFCFFSCIKKEICFDKKQAILDSLYVPKETKFGEDVPIYIKFEIDNGCGGFGDYTMSGVNRHFNLNVSLNYKGCICTEIFQYGNQIINYSPLAPGEFYLSYLLNGTIDKTDTFYVK